jgi:hypothetical protein
MHLLQNASESMKASNNTIMFIHYSRISQEAR